MTDKTSDTLEREARQQAYEQAQKELMEHLETQLKGMLGSDYEKYQAFTTYEKLQMLCNQHNLVADTHFFRLTVIPYTNHVIVNMYGFSKGSSFGDSRLITRKQWLLHDPVHAIRFIGAFSDLLDMDYPDMEIVSFLSELSADKGDERLRLKDDDDESMPF